MHVVGGGGAAFAFSSRILNCSPMKYMYRHVLLFWAYKIQERSMILYNMGSNFAARACFNSAYVSM